MILDRQVGTALAEDAATLAALHTKELTDVTLKGLVQLAFPLNLSLLPVGDASVNSFNLMRTALSSLPEAPDGEILDDLAADFAAIYLTGAFGASPSESFWLSDDRLVCQDAMFELRKLYATAGLAAPDWRQRPDDHLVFQLEFLSHRLAGAANDDDWRTLASFLDHHLLRWLPEFTARVADRCATLFYAGLALLTNAWCQQTRDLIASHLAEARPNLEEIARPMVADDSNGCEVLPGPFVPGGDRPSW